MRKIIAFIIAVSLAVTAAAQTALKNHVRDLSLQEPLKSSVWGVLAVRMNGDTLVSYNPGQRMVPASNTKIITTGAALKSLGADYRFHTAIAYSGEIQDSTLVGDVYIIGGGDPTLGSKDKSSIPVDRVFAKWSRILNDAGIFRVEGKVIGDNRRMAFPGHNNSWSAEDLSCAYGAGATALNFYENEQDFYTTPGLAAGDPVQVEVIYPDTPWMRYRHVCTTSEAGNGDELHYVNSDFLPVGEMHGTLATDKGRRKQECSNRFPALTCAFYFHRYLTGHGFDIDGGWADIDSEGLVRTDPMEMKDRPAATCQDSLTVIGSTASPALADIIGECLKRSDNLYADALLKAMGQELTECSSYDSSLVAEARVLESLGVSPEKRIQLKDGSGLSRKNYITPSYLVDFLKAMYKTPEAETFIHAMPQPGQGTLEFRLQRAPETLRKRIWMKSGSMNGVRCFSGYILPENGMTENTIVFSVMTNSTIVPTSQINVILDRLITLIGQQ